MFNVKNVYSNNCVAHETAVIDNLIKKIIDLLIICMVVCEYVRVCECVLSVLCS